MRAHSWLLIGLWLLGSPTAYALGDLPISVSVDPCVPGDQEQFERLLLMELGSAMASEPGANTEATQVFLTCVDNGIVLTVMDPITRKTMQRTLPAAPLHQAGSERLLALSVAEFLVASWIELSLQQSAPVEPIGPPVNPETLQAARDKVTRVQQASPAADTSTTSFTPTDTFARRDEPSSSFRLGAAFVWTEVLRRSAPDWVGGHLLFGIPLPERFQIELAALVMFGANTTDIGRINSNRIGGRALLYYRMRGTVGLQLGMGYGTTRFNYSAKADEGSGYQGDRGSLWLGGPLLSTRLSLDTGSSSDVGLRIDLGLFTTPAQLIAQNSGVTVDASGAWL